MLLGMLTSLLDIVTTIRIIVRIPAFVNRFRMELSFNYKLDFINDYIVFVVNSDTLSVGLIYRFAQS